MMFSEPVQSGFSTFTQPESKHTIVTWQKNYNSTQWKVKLQHKEMLSCNLPLILHKCDWASAAYTEHIAGV